MKNIKKFVFMELLCLVCFGVLFFGISSEADVDSSVFKYEKTPVYEEWTGKYSPEEINTRIQIYDIGRRLGKGIHYQETVQHDPFPFTKGNPAYKYSAARIYNSEKRGADIIYVGTTATVDTIKCLRMIVSGYLQEAFDLDAKAADDMAVTAIYWNTTVYNNTDFFSKEFDEKVMTTFGDRTKKIGLSSDYKEWPGNTKIIIPHQFTPPVAAIEQPKVEEKSKTEEVAVKQEESVNRYEEFTAKDNETKQKNDFEVVNVDKKAKGLKLPLPILISIILVIIAMIAAFVVLIVKNLDALKDKEEAEEKKGA